MIAKPRIALVHNSLIHHRIALFNLLTASNSWDFHFYFGGVHPWMKKAAAANYDYRPRFRYVTLKGLSLMEYDHFSPWLVFFLIRGRYDAYIGGPLSSPDCLATFLMAKCLRRPFVLWDERWRSSRSFLLRVVEPVQQLIMMNADVIIVPGSKSFRYFCSVVGENSARRLVVAPNASEVKKPSNYSVERFRSSHGIPGNRKTIVYLARLSPGKGIDILLRAFGVLEREFGDHVFLVVAGQGEEERNLRSLVNTLEVRNVTFTPGEIDEQAVYLSVADVVVLPSTEKRTRDFRPAEIWGLVVNEAASLGKPVVVTDVAGSAFDLVSRYGCAYIVKDGDCIKLYRAIRSILVDPELAQRMAKRGIQATKEAFSYEKMVQGFDRAIRQTLKS